LGFGLVKQYHDRPKTQWSCEQSNERKLKHHNTTSENLDSEIGSKKMDMQNEQNLESCIANDSKEVGGKEIAIFDDGIAKECIQLSM